MHFLVFIVRGIRDKCQVWHEAYSFGFFMLGNTGCYEGIIWSRSELRLSRVLAGQDRMAQACDAERQSSISSSLLLSSSSPSPVPWLCRLCSFAKTSCQEASKMELLIWTEAPIIISISRAQDFRAQMQSSADLLPFLAGTGQNKIWVAKKNKKQKGKSKSSQADLPPCTGTGQNKIWVAKKTNFIGTTPFFL